MTPDHQQLIENTLQLAYARTTELQNILAIPQGKNPPTYTREMLWDSPLARDLIAIANYTEGYAPPADQEDIPALINRTARALFGNTLSQRSFRLPHKFHKTPLGELFYAAFARCFPASAWMTTAEVQKLFRVKRQTIYDWAEESKITAYFVAGKQVYLRQHIEKYHAAWKQQKQQQPSRIVKLL